MGSAPSSLRAEQLRELIAQGEGSLIRRVLAYAQATGYSRYSSTLEEAWRASIVGLSKPILAALESSDEVPDLHPDEDFSADPIAAFGILEAQRHRARGIGLGMFLGLMKYYRQSYTDLITEATFSPEVRAWALLYVRRAFDRIELGYCTEWASESPAEHLEELQAANRRLANEKNKYLTLFSSLAPPVLLLDREDRVTDMNFAAEHLFFGGERPGQSYYGAKVDRVLPLSLATAVERFRDESAPQMQTSVSLPRDGEQRDYDVLIHRMLDVSGKFDGSTLVLGDVTDRLRLERQLREAREVLEQRVAARTKELERTLASLRRETEERMRVAENQRQLETKVREVQRLESLGVLAGGVAHDFNNLLTTILGNAELVKADLPADSPEHERLEFVASAGRHAADLCRQMLAYSGHGRLGTQDLDLGQLLRDMWDLLRASVPRAIRLRLEAEDGAATLRGDASQLRQVALNLISNAADAIGERDGAIDVRVGRAFCSRAELDATVVGVELPEGEYVALTVTDDGCGMEPATCQHVFDPFYSTKFVGRGLGLAVVLGIVRGHRGTISLRSEPGVGTTFRVLFPANSMQSDGHAPSFAGAISAKATAVRGTVLLADDDADVRSTTAMMLECDGWTVLQAGDGQEAVALWRDHRDEIARIVLDVTMPGLDGPAALAAMREAGCTVPAVLVSGYDEDELGEHSGGLELATVLQKPYSQEELLARLAERACGSA